jgi:hypothetical protein
VGRGPQCARELLIENATYKNTIGEVLLKAVWKDPDFSDKERAFYYARVIEIPTPRWTAYDAKVFGVEIPEGRRPVSRIGSVIAIRRTNI